MRIPEEVLSEILQRLDPAEIISEYVQLSKEGNRYRALCPFHSEKTPSFTLTPEKGLFYCFGCQKGGNLYTFLMEIEKLSFSEAVGVLAKRAGVVLQNDNKEYDAAARDAYTELYRRVSHSFHYLLMNGDDTCHARKYLESRGIKKDTIEHYNLGFAPNDRKWLCRFLIKKNYSNEFLAKSGLIIERNEQLRAFFFNRIMFPILNSRGETIAFGGRTISDDSVKDAPKDAPKDEDATKYSPKYSTKYSPKYINTAATPFFKKGNNVFGIFNALKSIKESGLFYLVEGYLDVLALHQAGVSNVVAPLGTALTEGQVRLLKRYAQHGVLFFDSDTAGFNATKKAIGLFESHDIVADVIEVDSGKDPADILVNAGTDSLKNVLNHTINGFQFLLKRAIVQYDVFTPEGKREAFNELYPFLTITDSEVKREGYLRLMAEILQVDYDSVRTDFQNRRNGKPVVGRSLSSPLPENSEMTPMTVDLFLLLAVSVNGEFFPLIRNTLCVDDLEDDLAAELFITLEECYRQEQFSTEIIVSKIDEPRLKRLLIEKTISDEFVINPERIVEESIRQIKKRSLENKRRHIESQLKSHDNEERNLHEFKELLQEKMFFDEELEKLK